MISTTYFPDKNPADKCQPGFILFYYYISNRARTGGIAVAVHVVKAYNAHHIARFRQLFAVYIYVGTGISTVYFKIITVGNG